MSERKPDEERVNRNPRVYPTSWIIWDGKRRGPELPEDMTWCSRTKIWWDEIRNSAQAMLMHPTDWSYMLDTAVLHNTAYSKKTYVDKDGGVHEVSVTPGELKSLMTEIRTRTDPYGFTHSSRVKYGINIATPEDLENEAVQAQIEAAPLKFDYREMFKEGS